MAPKGIAYIGVAVGARLAACGGKANDPTEAPEETSPPAQQGEIVEPSPAANPPRDGNPVEPIPTTPPLATPSTPTGAPTPASNASPPEPMQKPLPEPDPGQTSVVEGCSYVGAYERVFVFQRDAATGICTDLVLRSPDEDPSFVLDEMSLPVRWTVDDMSAFACSEDRSAVAGTTPTFFTRAAGNVTFGFAPGAAIPPLSKLDVVVSDPDRNAGTPDEEIIVEQRIVATDLAVPQDCRLFR